jgi:hypothetical protein
MRKFLPVLLCCCSTLAHGGDGWIAVSDAHLDAARGGFAVASGLSVSLGIERTVTVNGQVAVHTLFNVSNLADMDPGQVRLAHAALSSAALVQNGPGNAFHASLPESALSGMVIQNSLNDQVISNRTVINTSVNSLGVANAMRLLSTLEQAIAGALPSH